MEANTRWLLSALLVGIALGGIGGWQLARHAANASSQAHESDRAGGSTSGRAANGSTSSFGAHSESGKFTPSGDSSADFHRIFRIRDANLRTTALRQMLSSMSPEEMVKFMGELRQFNHDQEYKDQPGGLLALMASQEIVVEHASSNDPEAVLAGLLGGDQVATNEEFYAEVLRNWAARDPLAACRYFERNTLQEKDIDAKSVAGALVRELVKTDPEAAFRWLRGLKADFTDDVARDALQTLSHYDGVKAGKLLTQNYDLKKAPEFVAAMTAGWARTEPDKALQWALSLPSNISGDGIKTAAATWAAKDFPAALAGISSLRDEARAAALSGLASAADSEHLKQLLPMVEALPESADRASSVASLVNSWVDQSPEDASGWLARQPVGKSRDQGAIILALKMIHSEPASAMEWASSITTANEREKGVNGLIDVWLKQDPKAARAWVLESARLPEADRARLLEKTGR